MEKSRPSWQLVADVLGLKVAKNDVKWPKTTREREREKERESDEEWVCKRIEKERAKRFRG